jgi:hypothetical protein
MPVYVDDMHRTLMGEFGRMKMSHMIADTPAELLAMADTIGLNRKWIQKAGTAWEHFDVSKALRAKAVAAGAIEITMRDLAHKIRERRT